MNKDEQVKGMAQPNRGSVGVHERMRFIVTVGEILHALKLAQDALHMATLPFPIDEIKTMRALEAVTKVCDALGPKANT